MSLYRHLADREELLDAMLDVVYSELDLPDRPIADWRVRLEQIAQAQRRMLSLHHWVAALVGSRPPLLPGFLRYFEASLRTLLDAGLEITEAAGVSATVNAFVVGYALLEHSEHEARRRTGLNKRQWQRTTHHWSTRSSKAATTPPSRSTSNMHRTSIPTRPSTSPSPAFSTRARCHVRLDRSSALTLPPMLLQARAAMERQSRARTCLGDKGEVKSKPLDTVSLPRQSVATWGVV